MNDMSQVIIPKSDQISADDFIAGPKTYTIEHVEIRPGTEQPVSIFMIDEPRAWKPCKSMSRCLVAGWGPDANTYIGRSVTLYRDPKVKWGGMEVGGIRVSHMSHIDREMLMQLTATKGKRAPHIVKPLAEPGRQHDAAPTEDPATKWANAYLAKVRAAGTADELNTFANSKATKLAELENARPDLHKSCVAALDESRRSFISTGFTDEDDDNPFQEGPADDQRGERFNGTNEADGDVFDELEGWQIAVQTATDGANKAETLAELNKVDKAWGLARAAVPESHAEVVDKLIIATRKQLRHQVAGE